MVKVHGVLLSSIQIKNDKTLEQTAHMQSIFPAGGKDKATLHCSPRPAHRGEVAQSCLVSCIKQDYHNFVKRLGYLLQERVLPFADVWQCVEACAHRGSKFFGVIMRDILIVVDMQNDFINGSLGTREAQAIVGKVAEKVKAYQDAGRRVFFTRDTHESSYLTTFEGRHLPVPHCIKGTEGWQIAHELHPGENSFVVDKKTFGCLEWQKLVGQASSFELCGVCTDICVISNALIVRAMFPNCVITVDSSCCAGVTPQLHKAALAVMRSCQIEVL